MAQESNFNKSHFQVTKPLYSKGVLSALYSLFKMPQNRLRRLEEILALGVADILKIPPPQRRVEERLEGYEFGFKRERIFREINKEELPKIEIYSFYSTKLLHEIPKENKEYLNIHNILLQDHFIEKKYNIIQYYDGPLHQQHEFLLEKRKLDDTLTPTKYRELSAEYARRIAAMPKSITAEELNAVLQMLRLGPLITASTILGEVLKDKTQQVSDSLRQRVEHLVKMYQGTISEDTAIGKALRENIQPSVHSHIYDPQHETVADLNAILLAGNACTASRGEDLKHSHARLFAEDSKVGGSVHVQCSTSQGASYNRLYLAVDKEGKPVLFYDLIESGDMGRTTIESYLKAGQQDLLLGSFITSIVIANRLGVPRLSFGDMEIVDVAQHLGFGEKRIFSEDSNYEQKLGYKGGTVMGGGPYLWKMDHDKTFRTINPQLYQPQVLSQVVDATYNIMARIESNIKSVKRLQSNYQRFFGIADKIFKECRPLLGENMYLKLHGDITAFGERYHLKLEKSLSIPESTSLSEPVSSSQQIQAVA